MIFDYQVRKLNYMRQEVLEDLIRLRDSSEYDFVLMPSIKDLYEAHATVAQEGLRVFKKTTILAYELNLE